MNQNQSENWGGNRELDYDRFYNACDPLKPGGDSVVVMAA
ncbi:hypothetical protein MAESPC_04238 [Microcystis aeruginosa SPC777]|uniref:Uncharacterized protein n=2 Tax=Microcystis aeruginosa TaxID=1126 RepID=S3IZ44_MICAE|nr:hypothetical protein BH695_1161 [Microcystis aeruginosa PCC 7806SL]ELS47645.1 hypothetical protein C789_2594 [Microcystis aeruginosa FACHB-905 = DIANCHI905]EPF18988.1 hypothetical protein MAESPC_04238 [Microcystis aeruginosa SPC777]